MSEGTATPASDSSKNFPAQLVWLPAGSIGPLDQRLQVGAGYRTV